MSHDEVSSTGPFFGSKNASRPQIDGLGPVSDEYQYPAVGDEGDPDSTPAVVKPAKKSSAMREIIETLLLALIIFVAVRALVLNFKVDGRSMIPNLQNSEMLLVNRNSYLHVDLNSIINVLPWEDRSGTDEWYPFSPPHRGDIIVFNPPTTSDKPYIKRVIGNRRRACRHSRRLGLDQWQRTGRAVYRKRHHPVPERLRVGHSFGRHFRARRQSHEQLRLSGVRTREGFGGDRQSLADLTGRWAISVWCLMRTTEGSPGKT